MIHICIRRRPVVSRTDWAGTAGPCSSAAATGALPIAAIVATAASSGAMCLRVVRMVVDRSRSDHAGLAAVWIEIRRWRSVVDFDISRRFGTRLRMLPLFRTTPQAGSVLRWQGVAMR